MAEMSRRFNFDDFDAQIAEALAEHGTPEPTPLRRPGEIGSVAIRPSYLNNVGITPDFDLDPLPEPPEAA
jgi:hypothetical protein